MRAVVPAALLLARSQPHCEEAFLCQSEGVELRKFEARAREGLVEAMGRALDAVTAGDAWGFFEHRGYRVAAQLL